MTFKVLTSHQPSYLNDLFNLYAPTRPLRSSQQFTLTVPRVKTKIHSRAFEVYAPTLWNSLPQILRDITFQGTSLDVFKNI